MDLPNFRLFNTGAIPDIKQPARHQQAEGDKKDKLLSEMTTIVVTSIVISGSNCCPLLSNQS
jgi:hypothetical protein